MKNYLFLLIGVLKSILAGMRTIQSPVPLSKRTFKLTWVFGLEDDEAFEFFENLIIRDELDLRSDLEEGFIELIGDGEELEISLVRKPDSWPSDEPFCKPMLRAAIIDFYRRVDFEISQLKQIRVINLATPRIAGCKCYVRLMIDMGMTRINGNDGESVESSCQSETSKKSIIGQTVEGIARLPSPDSEAERALRGAFVDELEILPTPQSPMAKKKRKRDSYMQLPIEVNTF